MKSAKGNVLAKKAEASGFYWYLGLLILYHNSYLPTIISISKYEKML
jgi:hypothetical protein